MKFYFLLLCSVLILVPFWAGATHTTGEVPFPFDFVPDSELTFCADLGQDGSGDLGTGLKGFDGTKGHCFIKGKNVQPLSGASSQSVEATAKKECLFIPGAHWYDGATLKPPGYNTTGFCFLMVAAVGEVGGALSLVNQITNWFVAILVLFGIFYGIIGAFEFVTSGGEDKKLTTGKKKMYYAVGGVALGLLVKGIITLLVSFVGGLGG